MNNMSDLYNIARFIKAQEMVYQIALEEVCLGRKTSHWIWYIFPQLKGLGRSSRAQYYGICGIKEAKLYLSHKILGKRLREITQELLSIDGKSARDIFGELDAMKVRSSMTLFDAVYPNDIFAQVLFKYYNGSRCQITLRFLQSQ